MKSARQNGASDAALGNVCVFRKGRGLAVCKRKTHQGALAGAKLGGACEAGGGTRAAEESGWTH